MPFVSLTASFSHSLYCDTVAWLVLRHCRLACIATLSLVSLDIIRSNRSNNVSYLVNRHGSIFGTAAFRSLRVWVCTLWISQWFGACAAAHGRCISKRCMLTTSVSIGTTARAQEARSTAWSSCWTHQEFGKTWSGNSSASPTRYGDGWKELEDYKR